MTYTPTTAKQLAGQPTPIFCMYAANSSAVEADFLRAARQRYKVGTFVKVPIPLPALNGSPLEQSLAGLMNYFGNPVQCC